MENINTEHLQEITFKEVMAEFERRINQKENEDADFLQLLHIDNPDETESDVIEVIVANDEIKNALNEESKDSTVKGVRYDPNIGVGLNTAQH